MRFLIYILLFTGLASCKSNTSKTKIESSENLYSTESEDKQMNLSISNAKKSLTQFDTAFLNNNYDKTTFALKVRFETIQGAEHIWATNIQILNGEYYGVVDNLPELEVKVKMGEKIKINKKDISDWMYSDNGKLRGGFTMRLIRSRMNKEEKENFDRDFQLMIEE